MIASFPIANRLNGQIGIIVDRENLSTIQKYTHFLENGYIYNPNFHAHYGVTYITPKGNFVIFEGGYRERGVIVFIDGEDKQKLEEQLFY